MADQAWTGGTSTQGTGTVHDHAVTRASAAVGGHDRARLGVGRLATGGPRHVPFTPPTRLDGRHYDDQLMVSLYAQEASYGALMPRWDASTAIGLTGLSDAAAHESWDDEVADDDELTHHAEYVQVQELVRQSVRLPYGEPRCSARSLAAFLALTFGDLHSVQDGSARAFRHRVRQVSGLNLPSVSAHIRHMFSAQLAYSGLKSDGLTLRSNGAYLALECPLIGSGARAFSDEPFLAPDVSPWLRWGDCHLWLLPLASGETITVPSVPVQGATQFGVHALDVSTRVRRCEFASPNQLQSDRYRASTGKLRGSLLTAKRRTDLVLEMDVDTAHEERDVTWYLEQTPLAFEWHGDSGVLIDEAGTYRYGFCVLLPRVQLRAIPRSERENFDTLELQGRIMDDGVNPVLTAWVWNADEGYLLGSHPVAEPEEPTPESAPPLADDLTINGLAESGNPVTFTLVGSVLADEGAGRSIEWATLMIDPLGFVEGGTLEILTGGEVRFTPDPAWLGSPDLLATYTVADDLGTASNEATLTVTSV